MSKTNFNNLLGYSGNEYLKKIPRPKAGDKGIIRLES